MFYINMTITMLYPCIRSKARLSYYLKKVHNLLNTLWNYTPHLNTSSSPPQAMVKLESNGLNQPSKML